MSYKTVIAVVLILILILGTTLSTASTTNLKTPTNYSEQKATKKTPSKELIIRKVERKIKIAGKTVTKWYVVVSKKPPEESMIKPSYYTLINPDEGYYIVVPDRNDMEVNGTATVNVIAFNSKGPASGVQAVLQLCNYDFSKCQNYSIVTNNQGLARAIVKPSKEEYVINLVNYTSIATETNVRYINRDLSIKYLAMYGVAAQGQPAQYFPSYIVTYGEAKNITLKIFGIHFNGTPLSSKLYVTITLEPEGTTLFDGTVTPVNGVATVNIQVPKISTIHYLEVSVKLANSNTYLFSKEIAVVPGLAYVVALTNSYFEYNTNSLVIPLMVINNHRVVITNGTLTYSICALNETGWYCSDRINTTITNGLAYIRVNTSNLPAENAYWFEVDVGEVYVGNLVYVTMGDTWIEAYKYSPPPPTTTTTTPKKPPLEIHLYKTFSWPSGSEEAQVYIKAHVYEYGEPAPNLTVYFYLPWNGTEVYAIKTDSNGVAELNITDIIDTLYPEHPDLFYGRFTYIVAAVSNGEYAAFDYCWIGNWDIVNALGDVIKYDANTGEATVNPNYGKIRFPVSLDEWGLQHECWVCLNASWFLGVLSGGESTSVPIPKDFIGTLYLDAMVDLWSGELKVIGVKTIAYIELTRIGSVTNGNIWEWLGIVGSYNESIPIEGVVKAPNGENISNAHIYADMVYEYTDGSILKDTYSYSNGSFKIVMPPANGTTKFNLNVVGVLSNGSFISGQGDWVETYHGYISTPTTTTTTSTTTTTTTTTTSSTSTTATTTATTTTTVITTSPTLVGGVLKIYEENNRVSTEYLAIAVVAVTMLVAGAISLRRRK